MDGIEQFRTEKAENFFGISRVVVGEYMWCRF